MKVGDLVKFESAFFNAAVPGYANPGVILSECDTSSAARRSYRVMWADMRVTTEHHCFLKLLTFT